MGQCRQLRLMVMVACLAALSGCLSASPAGGSTHGESPPAEVDGERFPSSGKPEDNIPSGHDENGTGDDERMAPQAAVLPRRVLLTDCLAFRVGSNWLAAAYPEQPPNGWDRHDIFPVVSSYFEVLECHRITWGPFERGPIAFLFDTTTNLNAPVNCTDAAFNTHRLGVTWAVSDPEIERALARTTDTPVELLDYEISSQDLAEVDQYTVRAFAEPLGESRLVLHAQGTQSAVSLFGHRILWPTAAGVTVLDVITNQQAPSLQAHAATGFMGEGTLHGRTWGTTPTGIATLQYASSIEVSISKFPDLQCSDP